MPIDVQVPELAESIRDVVVARWIKADGERVSANEPLVELETDKANVEIAAESAGVLRIVKQEGETALIGDVVARIEEDDGSAASPEATGGEAKADPPKEEHKKGSAASPSSDAAESPAGDAGTGDGVVLSPAARRLVAEHGVETGELSSLGSDGRITKEDVLSYLQRRGQPSSKKQAPTKPATPEKRSAPSAPAAPEDGVRREPMSRLRLRIAERLVEAQRTAAILSTFNEVDMSAVIAWRARHKERFKEVHGVSLGFVSFFARACIGALKELPLVNAQIEGTDIVYRSHVNLGIAVASDRGLVVPVIHRADELGFPEIEKAIASLAKRAREGKLGLSDLTGGTFTISNGGVFGSLLSTPILNPPQSGILGMHKIEKRPIVIDDEVVIRPMMYLALSYDHRLIDGEQAVKFLVRVKERIEDPSRLMFEI